MNAVLAGYKVLIVDDAEDVRVAIRCFLELAGAIVVVAEGALEALETEAREKPDAVLLDMQLGDGDGRDVARALRAKGWLGPILALTGSSSARDEESYAKAGCTAMMKKPVDGFRLVEQVAGYLKERKLSATC